MSAPIKELYDLEVIAGLLQADEPDPPANRDQTETNL
jgi:hypothetical protein